MFYTELSLGFYDQGLRRNETRPILFNRNRIIDKIYLYHLNIVIVVEYISLKHALESHLTYTNNQTIASLLTLN